MCVCVCMLLNTGESASFDTYVSVISILASHALTTCTYNNLAMPRLHVLHGTSWKMGVADHGYWLGTVDLHLYDLLPFCLLPFCLLPFRLHIVAFRMNDGRIHTTY